MNSRPAHAHRPDQPWHRPARATAADPERSHRPRPTTAGPARRAHEPSPSTPSSDDKSSDNREWGRRTGIASVAARQPGRRPAPSLLAPEDQLLQQRRLQGLEELERLVRQSGDPYLARMLRKQRTKEHYLHRLEQVTSGICWSSVSDRLRETNLEYVCAGTVLGSATNTPVGHSTLRHMVEAANNPVIECRVPAALHFLFLGNAARDSVPAVPVSLE